MTPQSGASRDERLLRRSATPPSDSTAISTLDFLLDWTQYDQNPLPSLPADSGQLGEEIERPANWPGTERGSHTTDSMMFQGLSVPNRGRQSPDTILDLHAANTPQDLSSKNLATGIGREFAQFDNPTTCSPQDLIFQNVQNTVDVDWIDSLDGTCDQINKSAPDMDVQEGSHAVADPSMQMVAQRAAILLPQKEHRVIAKKAQSRRPFGHDERIETARTRNIGACIRCNIQRGRVSVQVHEINIWDGSHTI
jgi:hypothetical protein